MNVQSPIIDSGSYTTGATVRRKGSNGIILLKKTKVMVLTSGKINVRSPPREEGTTVTTIAVHTKDAILDIGILCLLF